MPFDRPAIVAEAKTYLGTAYHHLGQIKGVGVDCMTFIVCVGQSQGLLQDFEMPRYSSQFGAHRDEETYIDGLVRYCREVDAPQPADIVIWQMGRTYSHAAIVVDWPLVIHAHAQRGVVLEDAEASGWLKFANSKGKDATPRPRKFFSYG